LLLLLIDTGLNGDGAQSACAHAGRAQPAGRLLTPRRAMLRKKGQKSERSRRGLPATVRTAARAFRPRDTARVAGMADQDRHQAGHHNGFPRSNVRITHSTQDDGNPGRLYEEAVYGSCRGF
jgi:hypothetical protein